MLVYFGFFVVSGFCSLSYEVVWLRLAMAHFGVTTPFVATVLSVFMAGLSLGSWAAGVVTRRLGATGAPARPLRLYALAEAVIGLSGLLVPYVLAWGREVLTTTGMSWDSSHYYLVSGGWIALALSPACLCMGATFPLAMAAMRRELGHGTERTFSYLYLANVLGATSGTLVSAFVLIELVGFQRTAAVAASLNALVAVGAALRSLTTTAAAVEVPETPPTAAAQDPGPSAGRAALVWLFLTGLVSLAMEVVWIRQFTPFLATNVYAFAAVLALYLLATAVGTWVYRTLLSPSTGRAHDDVFVAVSAILGLLALIPMATADPQLRVRAALRVAGIAPFCGALGILTPMLLDRWSAGNPQRAGAAYAVNIVGAILGPLVAGFWLLPWLGDQYALLALTLPLFGLGALAVARPTLVACGPVARARARVALMVGATAISSLIVTSTRSFESRYLAGEIRRDHTATVIAAGAGMEKRLLVNGITMTHLTPITKMMAHLPLAFLERPPTDGLVVALGMGTSLRSMHSWGIRATAVELVPSVPSLFGYFHTNAPQILASGRAHIVVDDGRRFLERTVGAYDVITIDPPPPIEAAGSSLLYSREFYHILKKRLRPDGIVQLWFLGGEDALMAAAVRAFEDEFPGARLFHSVEGRGLHFLGRMRPIPTVTAAALASRMPPDAVRDMLEWGPARTAEEQFRLVLSREVLPQILVARAPSVPALDDDRPFNEYFFLRRTVFPWWWSDASAAPRE